MNYSEVKKELKREFESFLKPLGYKSKYGNQGCDFFVSESIGYRKIGFGIAKYEPVFYTGIYAYVGVDAIDKVLCYILEMDYIKSIGGGGTISTSTRIYFNDINYQYKIQTEIDIRDWFMIFKKFYNDHLTAFFVKYNTIDSIDKLLNEHPTEKVVYCDDLGWRIIKGLITAKLNRNPKYYELRDYYKNEVETKFQGYFMYEKCMKVIEFLDSHSTEELNKMAESI